MNKQVKHRKDRALKRVASRVSSIKLLSTGGAILSRRFASDQKGSTAIMFALMITPVMLMTGAAVDFSRMVTVRARMQTAADATALAAVQTGQKNGFTATSIEGAANTYFNAMKSGVPLALNPTLTQSSSSGTGGVYTWTASAYVQTPFMSVAQMILPRPLTAAQSANLPASCNKNAWQCQLVSSKVSVTAANSGKNTGYSIETSFMLDITGSMNGQKLTDLKAAANDAIEILVWGDQSVVTSKVAISPFAQDVRMPSAAVYTAVTGQTAPASTIWQQIYGTWFSKSPNQYCVVERTGAQAYTDAAPSGTSRPMTEWLTYDTDASGNGVCNVPATAAVQPLTSDKTVLHNLVNGLQTAGGTAGHLGTAWAWYMLSPNWASLWDVPNRPGAYDTAYNVNTKSGDPTKTKLKKIAVLMTDGDYNTQYTSQGTDSDIGGSPANDWSSNQATQLCANMKAKGIEVYTVGFGSGLSGAAQTVLSGCATDASHFYMASSGDALKFAFRDIALKIATLRISG
jgi:Flp pilus assembly protein TadG